MERIWPIQSDPVRGLSPFFSIPISYRNKFQPFKNVNDVAILWGDFLFMYFLIITELE